MDIRNPRELKSAAAHALSVGREPKKLILGYACAFTLLALVVSVIDFAVSSELDKAVGLSNLGLNSLLSTVQVILPIAQTLVVLCLSLGYQSGMLRIGRKLYADHNELKTGFRRFWPLLRCTALQAVLYFALCFLLIYPTIALFMLTPFSNNFWTLYNSITVVDESAIMQVSDSLMPMMVIFLILYLAACIPIQFHFRMAHFILLDKPQEGAFSALRGSFRMMRRNCLNLFKVDLHLWWYHLAVAAMTVISYGNLLLPLLGISLPWSDTVSFYVFYGIYLAGMFGVDYFLRNRAELTYVMAYEALRPKEQPTQGVILGNIFQM